jgi:enoyl-CoA hydratase/carnithine racemase
MDRPNTGTAGDAVDFETLKYEKDDRVVTITLNRPEALNAISQKMFEELPAAWKAFDEDKDAWVAIFTGAGDRALCSGVDVKEQARSGNMSRDRRDNEGTQVKLTARHCEVGKPVICAINGLVGGGGLMFVSDADIVIAADHAQIFNPGVSVGIIAPYGPIIMARKMPFEAVMRMILVGNKERMSAQRAYELGLIGEVVAKDDLLPAARRIAEKIAENSPTAVRLAKQCLWEAYEMPLSQALENSARIMKEYRTHPDLAEGPRAFAEKRKPVWTVR